jgi:hypothetical protein
MARTLQQLKESVERLIQQQGENSPVAAFIFTKEDVIELDENFDPISLSDEIVEEVLNEIEENDWIYEQIGTCIDDEVRDAKKRLVTP